MINNLWNKCFVLLSRVLRVQDAILFMFESHASEAIFAQETVVAVEHFGAAVPAQVAEPKVIRIVPTCLAEVDQLCILAPVRVIHTVR